MLNKSQIINTPLFLCLFYIISITSSHSASTEPLLLSAPDSKKIERFSFDPSNQYLVFNDFDQNDILNRFSVKIGGMLRPIKIAENLSNIERNFSIAPDDLRVIHRDEDDLGIDSSFISTNIDGSGTPVILSPPNPENIRRSSAFPDTDLLLFSTNEGGLYTIPYDGSRPAVDLSDGFITDHFIFSLDRQKVLFSAEVPEVNRTRLFSANPDGSSGLTLLTEFPENTTLLRRPVTSSDGNRLFYITTTISPDSVQTIQLFSILIDGSADPVQLSDTFTGDSIIIDFALSDDGKFVAFSLENLAGAFDESSLDELFTVPADGSASPTFIASFSDIRDFMITNNGQTILISERTLDQNFDTTSRLFSYPFDASSPAVQIFPNSDFEFDISPQDFQTSVDSEFVFYTARNLSTFEQKLYKAKADGSGQSIQISADTSTVSNKQVDQFRIDFINSRVIYSTNSSDRLPNELFTVNFDGTGFSTLASVNANIDRFTLSPDKNFVAYNTSPFDSFNFELSSLFLLDISPEPEEICFPIKAQNDSFVTICL